jgi:hypothetical protein
MRTASWRNSSVLLPPKVTLLRCSKCYQRRGIKPRQVQGAAEREAAIVATRMKAILRVVDRTDARVARMEIDAAGRRAPASP